ncbi:MAG: cold shock domain-containing protein [Porticoccaceae bacterium]|nr:cold shock domain-containing protein [Porticoccaceae bacterium]
MKCLKTGKDFAFITPEDGDIDFFVRHSEIQSGGSFTKPNDSRAADH